MWDTAPVAVRSPDLGGDSNANSHNTSNHLRRGDFSTVSAEVSNFPLVSANGCVSDFLLVAHSRTLMSYIVSHTCRPLRLCTSPQSTYRVAIYMHARKRLTYSCCLDSKELDPVLWLKEYWCSRHLAIRAPQSPFPCRLFIAGAFPVTAAQSRAYHAHAPVKPVGH